jgi:hypothetical protein
MIYLFMDYLTMLIHQAIWPRMIGNVMNNELVRGGDHVLV